MRYLKLQRSRILLLSFLTVSVVLAAFPEIDFAVSRVFFDGNAFPQNEWWQRWLRESLAYFLCISLATVTAIYVFNRLLKRNVANVNGRKLLYLVMVLAIGAGLIVNVVLKDNFGRARPRNVIEFNGDDTFTPAFVFSGECDKNCSFSSGDAAAGFFAIALATALARRRAWFAAAIATGALVSLGRISSGAHFFSDTVVSFFVMWIVADVLYYYVVLKHAVRRERTVGVNATEPAYATMSVESKGD